MVPDDAEVRAAERQMITRLLKDVLRATPLYDYSRTFKHRREYARWMRNGRQPPPTPHLEKRKIIADYARRHGTRVLIETGTYLGEMLVAMRHQFDRLYSIELSEELFRRAERRLAKLRHVELLQGDSAAVLPRLLSRLHQPGLFWLDGHYSAGLTARGDKETPVVSELEHILADRDRDHVILIDDARCFVGRNDYPTVDEVRQLVSALRPGWVCEVCDDIIRIHAPVD